MLVASAPASQARRDEQPSNDAIGVAARLAGEAAVPRSGSEYKRQVVEALTKRLLEGIAERIEGSES